MQTKYDVIVLGAGISGLAVALEAAKRGKKVCLLDKSSCGNSTSNNSLRIIHGGLRYLQKLDFPRIVTSVSDQTYCLKKWPDLIKPLRCVAPLSGNGIKRTNLARVATVLYSCFLGALNSPLEKPYVDPRPDFEGLPFLSGLAQHGFLVWQDALLLDHAALVQKIIQEIRDLGGTVLENAIISEVKNQSNAVTIKYDFSGSLNEIHSEFAVNCLGPWVDRFAQANQISNSNKWCLAFNLILKKQYSSDLAFGADGAGNRYFFFVPRDNKTVLGTGYIEFSGSVDDAKVADSEVEKFIKHAALAVPKLELSVQDIEAVECGVLPMKASDAAGNIALYGAGKITQEGKMVRVLSTKYTTFRSQALEALKLMK